MFPVYDPSSHSIPNYLSIPNSKMASSFVLAASVLVPTVKRTNCSTSVRSRSLIPMEIKQSSCRNRGRSRLRNLAAIGDETRTLTRVSSKDAKRRYAYLVVAMLSSIGITSIAAVAVYSRFSWQFDQGGDQFPVAEMLGTFALSVGAAVGMEYWARWAHRALWHDSLWNIHKSHHKARKGAFEANDVFAVTNAMPAIGLLSFGFFNEGFFFGLCFGAGLGITAFGMAYVFVHDGLVHGRFPVGPISNVPYLRKVAAAHRLHHAGKFNGVPYGLFLGPQELQEIGGTEELEKEINRRIGLSI
ncbi:hypothetical protein LINPERHAP1_LOCUS14339 [Linum perenne]